MNGLLLSFSDAVTRLNILKGDIGIFGFEVLTLFEIGFSVFVPKDFGFSVFRFRCSLQFADFSFFCIPFSVFVENNSGFLVLLSNVFLFGFGRIFWRFCGFG